jgi:hypothetical protein
MRAAREALARRQIRLAAPAGHDPSNRSSIAAPAWSLSECIKRIGEAVRIGPEKLSPDGLIAACRHIHEYSSHCWIDARPFFVEVKRRVKRHLIPGVRTLREAWAQIGCSDSWARRVVAGTAHLSNKHKRTKTHSSDQGSTIGARSTRTDKDYADAIVRFAIRILQPLMVRDRVRFEQICIELEEFFRKGAEGDYEETRTQIEEASSAPDRVKYGSRRNGLDRS